MGVRGLVHWDEGRRREALEVRRSASAFGVGKCSLVARRSRRFGAGGGSLGLKRTFTTRRSSSLTFPRFIPSSSI